MYYIKYFTCKCSRFLTPIYLPNTLMKTQYHIQVHIIRKNRILYKPLA